MARAAASASAAGENRVGKEPSSIARESDITKKAHCQDMAAEGVRAARSQAHRVFLIAFIFRKSRDKSFGFHDDCFAS